MTKDTNTGYYNTGYYNTGDYNTGYRNTGDYNTGDRNTGDYNTGYYNTGYYNTGDYNTGYRNTGDYNTGDRNTGDYNTGYRNTGNRNTGDCNTGDYNTGNHNTGYRNTGDCNTGDYNTGWFNNDEPKARFFNKECEMTLSEFYGSDKVPSWSGFDLTTWVSESIMTNKEKEENPTYKTTGGYLKELSYKEAWSVFWRKTSEENRQKFLDLPNFDAKIFEEITGIDVNEKEKDVLIDGKKYSVSTVKEALRAYVD